MPTLHDPEIEKIFAVDRQFLKDTKIPIVTVSGTFQEDLKKWHELPNNEVSTDVVFSRAHFSMAYAAARYIWNGQPDERKAWLVDPTNYVSSEKWKSIKFTEYVGKVIARVTFLKTLKDLIDRFGRNKLPILDSITPPLLYLFEDVNQPILSFHITAGNILAKLGKTVVQVITDPHVREDYLENAHLPNMYFCVFDEETKFEALEKAFMNGKNLDPDRVIVTGPPIDERIIALRAAKKIPKKKLKLLITTGGLGTNKSEIRSILQQLLPQLKKKDPKIQLMLYAGTQQDFVEMATDLAKEARVKINIINTLPHLSSRTPDSTSSPLKQGGLSVLHHPQLFDANELLIRYGFPWAQGVITKPSGDMGYDAAAAGCFLLTLKPWGVWEERIEEIFWRLGISRKAESAKIMKQLEALKMIGWIDQAMEATKELDPLYLNGVKKIVQTVKKMPSK